MFLGRTASPSAILLLTCGVPVVILKSLSSRGIDNSRQRQGKCCMPSLVAWVSEQSCFLLALATISFSDYNFLLADLGPLLPMGRPEQSGITFFFQWRCVGS
ncbi:hypothetical protein TRVL_02539 [Trypanosoma vivax]|nr:hypothetical protein TRVL_02539 [Trypanosoma vivax]